MRRPLCMFCSFVCILVALLYFGRGGQKEPTLPWKEGDSLMLWGIVCDKDTDSFTMHQLVLDASFYADSANPDLRSSSAGQITNLKKRKIQCDYPKDWTDTQRTVKIGQPVCVQGRFEAFPCATNPGQFDAKSYYLSKSVLGRLKKTENVAVSLASGTWGRGYVFILGLYGSLREGFYQIRQFLHNRIVERFGQQEAGVVCAILLGEKSEVEKELKGLYQRNGIIHILSVSGLHISFLGLGLFKLLRWVGIPVKASAVFSSLVMVLYGGVIGAGISAVRAIGMFLIRMLSHLFGRTYDAPTALALMAAVTLIASPNSLENSGFYLSYGSVLGLLLVMPLIGRMGKMANEASRFSWIGGFIQAIIPGVAILVFTLPIQLWFLYEIPVTGLLLNLFVVPAMSAVLVLGALALLPGLGFAAYPVELLLGLFEGAAKWMEQNPYHMWRAGKPTLLGVVLYYCILAAVLVYAYRCGGKERKVPIIAGFVLAVFCLTGFRNRDLKITFLDVGQGLSCVVTTQNQDTYLFDCGSTSYKNVGEKILIPYLNHEGIRTIKKVFISHADEDHMNGVVELLKLAEGEGILLEELVLPVGYEEQEELITALTYYCKNHKPELSVLCEGDALQLPEMNILCLNPMKKIWLESGKTRMDTNETSLCLYVELLKDQDVVTMLLTGDLEGARERDTARRLKAYQLPPIQILQVGHHGSENASGEELLKQLAGDSSLAVISCGKNNSYGHPHESTLNRLNQFHFRIRRTDLEGAVILTPR